MNGTVIDIQNIFVNVIPIYLENSTDKAYILEITDKEKKITIEISYGKIKEIRCN